MKRQKLIEAFSYIIAVAQQGIHSDADREIVAEDAYEIDKDLRELGLSEYADGFKKVMSLLMK